MVTNTGLVRLKLHVLTTLLRLPDEVRVVAVEGTRWDQIHAGEFRVRLEGPGLPEVNEGDLVPEIECPHANT